MSKYQNVNLSLSHSDKSIPGTYNSKKSHSHGVKLLQKVKILSITLIFCKNKSYSIRIYKPTVKAINEYTFHFENPISIEKSERFDDEKGLWRAKIPDFVIYKGNFSIKYGIYYRT